MPDRIIQLNTKVIKKQLKKLVGEARTSIARITTAFSICIVCILEPDIFIVVKLSKGFAW